MLISSGFELNEEKRKSMLIQMLVNREAFNN